MSIIRFLDFFAPERRLAIHMIFCTVALQCFALLAPLISHLILDNSTSGLAIAESQYIVLGYAIVLLTAALCEDRSFNRPQQRPSEP